jgi:hypothetical protein
VRRRSNGNAVYLVGDWTRRDDAITAELQRHSGRSGVPLYCSIRRDCRAGGVAWRCSPGVVVEALMRLPLPWERAWRQSVAIGCRKRCGAGGGIRRSRFAAGSGGTPKDETAHIRPSGHLLPEEKGPFKRPALPRASGSHQ